MSSSSIHHHLVIQTAFVGDLLLGIPLFKQLRQMRPDDRIVLLCRKGLGQLLLQSGLVDEIIEIDKSNRSSLADAQAQLSKRHFDLLFCPHQSFRSTLIASRVKANRKIGYRRFFNFFTFDDRPARPLDVPESIRQLALLAPIDPASQVRVDEYAKSQSLPGGLDHNGKLLDVPSWADMTVPLFVKIRDEFKSSGRLSSASQHVQNLAARVKCDHTRPIAFLAPGSVWPTKMWTKDGFIGVAKKLLADGFQVIISGAPQERVICEEIVAAAPGAISLAGETSLLESAELLSLADILICNDSGSMHMAAAAGVPTISVFGPTILEFGYRPWQNRARVVQTSDKLTCRPCGSHGAKACPVGTHECMKSVSCDQVLQAANLLLKGSDHLR